MKTFLKERSGLLPYLILALTLVILILLELSDFTRGALPEPSQDVPPPSASLALSPRAVQDRLGSAESAPLALQPQALTLGINAKTPGSEAFNIPSLASPPGCCRQAV